MANALEADTRVARLLHYMICPYTDPDRKQSAHGDSLYALDGIRGLATLVVIASHTQAFGMHAQGGLGVILFFLLSGFVLSLPFTDSPGRILNASVVWRFAASRALRIIPIFVFAVLFIAWLNGANWKWVLSNVSFYAGWNHLWTVAEEARFYFLFPFVIALLALLPRRSIRILALSVMICIAWEYRTAHDIDMMDGRFVQFFFWVFLSGILACFLFASDKLRELANNRSAHIFFGSAALLIILFMFASSDAMISYLWRPLFPSLPNNLSLNGWHHPELWCGLFGILLVTVTVLQRSWASRWMQSWHMRHLGLLSYSMYLFHIPVLMLVSPYGFKNASLFAVVFLSSYIIAIVSYVAIEKPFLMLKPKAALRSYCSDNLFSR